MYFECLPGTKLKEKWPCPLCDTFAFKDSDERLRTTLVVCRICGRFRLASDVPLPSSTEPILDQRYKISYVTRTRAERARGKKDNSFFPIYTSGDFMKMLAEHDLSVQSKVQALLMYVGSSSEFPGQEVVFDAEYDYVLLNAKNSAEATFHLESLSERGFIGLGEQFTNTPLAMPCRLTANGWIELDRIAQSGADSSDAFIAMWFDPSRSAVETAITGAIRTAGYLPIRIDRVEHLNRIDDEIIARIRQSRFLVADFSGQRNGVYFEAGFMLGLGRPVIWLCEKADLDKVHFDTRQYNTIDYADAEELRKRLQFRIEANIGKGAHRNAD